MEELNKFLRKTLQKSKWISTSSYQNHIRIWAPKPGKQEKDR